MLGLLLAIAIAESPVAPRADWDALFSNVGWSQVATPSPKDTGTIDLRLKEIGGLPCLRGEVQVAATRASLQATVVDIPGSPKFSSETLMASDYIGQTDTARDYYQILDVPDWTLSSDRFWVLRGEDYGDAATGGFRWNRFDWRTAYPDLATKIDAEHADAVEPTANWGAWTFTGNGEGTLLRYQICTDAGGSIPNWIKKAAATKTLPNTIADVVREAKRRDAAAGTTVSPASPE